jgi:hypothetical protein
MTPQERLGGAYFNPAPSQPHQETGGPRSSLERAQSTSAIVVHHLQAKYFSV